MSLWNLDPRQAGVTEPDVQLIEKRSYGHPADRGWYALTAPDAPEALCSGPCADAASALRALREQAGLGHVAEQPCDRFRPHEDAHPSWDSAEYDECSVEDGGCAWPSWCHGKGER